MFKKKILVIISLILSQNLIAQPFYDSIDKEKLPNEIQEYGRLVGEWNCAMENLKNGNWVKDSAIWEFKYILGGSAIQDFWYNPNEKTGVTYLGTNIRIYNPKTGKWECVWIENQTNNISSKWESYKDENGAMVLHDGTGKWEIKFYNINSDTFDWKWDFKQPDGSMQTNLKMKAYKIK